MKGREREKCPLSFNIMSHAPHTSIIELNLVKERVSGGKEQNDFILMPGSVPILLINVKNTAKLCGLSVVWLGLLQDF